MVLLPCSGQGVTSVAITKTTGCTFVAEESDFEGAVEPRCTANEEMLSGKNSPWVMKENSFMYRVMMERLD